MQVQVLAAMNDSKSIERMLLELNSSSLDDASDKNADATMDEEN